MEEARQTKRRIQLPVIAGGGIEGLVVWGGALAVASLVAVFTIRKGRKKDDAKTDKDQPTVDLLHESGMKEREDVGGKALQFVIPETHSIMNENSSEKFYEVGVKEIDPSESVPNWNSIAEENALQAVTDANVVNKNSMGGHQEILLSDTEQESIAISEDYCVAEEFPLPVPDSESESMAQNGKEGSSKMETFDAEHVAGDKSSSMGSSLSSASSTDEEEEDSPIQSSMSSMMSSEEEDDSSAIQSTLSTEEGKEDNDEDDHVMEKSEESLEGTRSSSEKSKMEAAWPAEMVEVLSSKSKGIDLSSKIPGEKYKQKDTTTGECCYLVNGNNGGVENMRMIKKKETLGLATKRMIWVNSILVIMLLFLLANLVLSFYLPSDNSSVIL
ncbi:hypothetical protein SLE2022_332270 [Rubroshorea leprosula]